MEGRWTIYVCTGCGEATGRHNQCDAKREATPVVPCDEVAVERAARAMCGAPVFGHDEFGYWPSDAGEFRNLAEIALRAAGEDR